LTPYKNFCHSNILIKINTLQILLINRGNINGY